MHPRRERDRLPSTQSVALPAPDPGGGFLRLPVAILILTLTLVFPAGGVYGQAGEEGITPQTEPVKETVRPTASFDLGIFSQYIWRGAAYSNGKSVVIQPSATVEYYGFSLNLWGNLDTYVEGVGADSPAWNETDFTAAYDHTFGPVGVGVAYLYYGLDGVPDSQEVSVTVSVDTILSPAFTAYREMAHYPGWYLVLELSQSFDLLEQEHWGLSLDLAGSVGYIDLDGSGGYFDDLMISAGFTVPFYKYFSVTPMVAYTMYLSGAAYNDLKALSVDNKADHVFGGFTASISF